MCIRDRFKGELARGEHKSLQTDRVILQPGPDDEVAAVNQIYRWFVEGNLLESEIADPVSYTHLDVYKRQPCGLCMEPTTMIKRCACCGNSFEPRPQVPDQAYCSSPDCQRARKRQWQRAKLQSDSDYRINQRAAQQAWSQRNPDYWRNYRDARPEYEHHNREPVSYTHLDVYKRQALATPSSDFVQADSIIK